jgi:hypothetical protein
MPLQKCIHNKLSSCAASSIWTWELAGFRLLDPFVF